MRYCSFSAVRNLTLFTLVVLSSHSLVSVNAQSSNSATDSVTSPVSAPASTPSTSIQTSPTTASVVSQSSSSSSGSSTAPTSVASSAESAASSVQSSSSSKSSSSSASETSLSSSTISSVSSIPSQPSNTLSVPAAPVYPTGGYSSYSYSNGLLPVPTTKSNAPSQTGVAAAADKGFSSNKGAITAVGIIGAVVGISLLAFIVFKVMKRRARMRDEEDEMYFEKYQEQEPPLNSSGPVDTSYNIATATRPAAADAYPDRAYHYGSTQQPAVADAYANPQQYGMEYPPGTAYAGAAHGGQYAAHGAQYQYSGDANGYGAQAPHNHPYAHSQNSFRPAAAPPVAAPAYDHQADSGYAQ